MLSGGRRIKMRNNNNNNFASLLNLLFAGHSIFLRVICELMMTKSKRLSNKMFYDSFAFFILGETIPEVQFFCSIAGYV